MKWTKMIQHKSLRTFVSPHVSLVLLVKINMGKKNPTPSRDTGGKQKVKTTHCRCSWVSSMMCRYSSSWALMKVGSQSNTNCNQSLFESLEASLLFFGLPLVCSRVRVLHSHLPTWATLREEGDDKICCDSAELQPVCCESPLKCTRVEFLASSRALPPQTEQCPI